MIPFDLTFSVLSEDPNPESRILSSSAYWIPLQMLYVEVIKSKDLEPVSCLPKEIKEKYWSKVMGYNWPQWKKISVIQALYVYDNREKLG